MITGRGVGKSSIIYSVNMCGHQWGAGRCDESQGWLESLDNSVHLINPQPISSDWSNYAPPHSFLPNRSSVIARKIGKFPPQFFTVRSEGKKKKRENKLENTWEEKMPHGDRQRGVPEKNEKSSKYTSKGKKKPKSTIPSEGHSI